MQTSFPAHSRSFSFSLVFFLACACSKQETPTARAPAPPPEEEAEVSLPGPSPADIKSAVHGQHDALTECYIAGTFDDHDLAGTVNVAFTIETTGKVSGASDAGSDLGDPKVISCVIGVFSALEFPPGKFGATEVTYPVRFGRRG